MTRTYYNSEPQEFERDKFCATIRLDIREEDASGETGDGSDAGQTPQYSAMEFTQYEPITQNLFIELIFTALYGNDYENKLINEYNAAQMGLYPDGEIEQKIMRYKTFLQERAQRKADIERICNENGIQ